LGLEIRIIKVLVSLIHNWFNRGPVLIFEHNSFNVFGSLIVPKVCGLHLIWLHLVMHLCYASSSYFVIHHLSRCLDGG
jgi:hypothetical protein